MTAQPIIDTHVSETRPPALCDVCGMDTAILRDCVIISRPLKGEEEKILAVICIQCYSDGALWAARKSLAAKKAEVQEE